MALPRHKKSLPYLLHGLHLKFNLGNGFPVLTNRMYGGGFFGDRNLFSSGWRDPSDDGLRLAIYIIAFLSIPMGLCFQGFGAWCFTHATSDKGLAELGRTAYLIGAGAIAVGLAQCYASFNFLRNESRRWNLRNLNAERVVAGGFLLGFAFMVVGVYFMSIGGVGGIGFILIGLALLLCFLFIGLACAYWPQFALRRRYIRNATIELRFCVNDKLMTIPDHPFPIVDKYIAGLIIKTKRGKTLRLRCDPKVYKEIRTGDFGHVTIRKNTVTAFDLRRSRLKD